MSNYDVLSESRKELVNTIIELMKQEGLKWTAGWSSIARPYNPVSNIIYRGGNVLRLLVASQKNQYTDPRWLTYKQAKEKGWQVKKGSRGVRLEKWIFEKEETVKDSITGEEKKIKVGLDKAIPYSFTVFNASQIDGIPELVKMPLHKNEIYEIAETFIASSECPVKESPDGRNYYSPGEDAIYLTPANSFITNDARLATALHEMAHSTGHESRLNRQMDYAQEELVAEIATVFVKQNYGIEVDAELENHAAYLKSWIKALNDDPNELFRAAAAADKASDRLVENYEKYAERETIFTKMVSEHKFNLENQPTSKIHTANEIAATSKELEMFLDQTGDEESFAEIMQRLKKGSPQRYLNRLHIYRESSPLPPNDLLQLSELAKQVETLHGERPSEFWDIKAAVESTNNHSDYYFHPDRTENKDFYRIVYINSYGDIQPLTGHVFNTPEEASEHLKTINAVQEIPYDDLVNNVLAARSIPETKQLRETYYEKLEELKEKMNAIGWRFMFAYGQETSWCKFNEQHEIQDIRFDRLSDVEDYLEKIQIETEIIDREPRRYNDQGERLYGGKTTAEFTPEDKRKFLEETEKLLNFKGMSVEDDKAFYGKMVYLADSGKEEDSLINFYDDKNEFDKEVNYQRSKKTLNYGKVLTKEQFIEDVAKALETSGPYMAIGNMLHKDYTAEVLKWKENNPVRKSPYPEMQKLKCKVEMVHEWEQVHGLQKNNCTTIADGHTGQILIRSDAAFNKRYSQIISQHEEISTITQTKKEYTKGQYDIYQLNNSEAARKYRFESMRYVESLGIKISKADYNHVYSAPLEGMSLDQIFEKFNTSHPSDFTGHSLSVSDVVVLHQEGKTTSYYVDSIGFKEMPDFFKDISKDKIYEKSSITERLAAKKAELENNHKESPNLQRNAVSHEFSPDL